jgi:hypothetical protein
MGRSKGTNSTAPAQVTVTKQNRRAPKGNGATKESAGAPAAPRFRPKDKSRRVAGVTQVIGVCSPGERNAQAGAGSYGENPPSLARGIRGGV